jgi:NAD(P)-dependent dehydrogenase (short-subunit alcohol dehydrogenase family)
MPEQPQNQPIFNINQVGNINTGDTTIAGDQIGIQYNYTPEPNTEAEQQLDQLLTKLRNQYPNKTDAEIFDILINNFATMPQTHPQTWQRWQDIFSVIFAGGVEATKVLVPMLGIPIEVLKRLYEIYDRNNKQLPGT